MPYLLGPEIAFPSPALADDSGLLAVGGDLSPRRLLLAYHSGIFPWPCDGFPLLWHSPPERMVLLPGELRVNRSLRKALARRPYEVRLDTAFERVISACAATPRPGQDGTWITDEMRRAYCHLHELGFAHCAEAWRGDELVGGLYGVHLGGAFCGESMFARAPDASKIAFVTLTRLLHRRGTELIDCQVYTDHMARFGARTWPRDRFLAALERGLRRPTWRGPWPAPEETPPAGQMSSA